MPCVLRDTSPEGGNVGTNTGCKRTVGSLGNQDRWKHKLKGCPRHTNNGVENLIRPTKVPTKIGWHSARTRKKVELRSYAEYRQLWHGYSREPIDTQPKPKGSKLPSTKYGSTGPRHATLNIDPYPKA